MGSDYLEMGRNQIMKGLACQTQEFGPFLEYPDTSHSLSSVNDPLPCVLSFIFLFYHFHSILLCLGPPVQQGSWSVIKVQCLGMIRFEF